ncbi:putative LRR receptor-like serine/threonine-protein kinase RFK1 isoform X2 [Capsicum chacoense]
MLTLKRVVLSWILVVNYYFTLLNLGESRVAQEEVDILEQIATTMGATHWKFNDEFCQIEAVGVTTDQPSWSETDVECNCTIGNDTACHIVAITLKGISLPGALPPELVKLPYIQKVDFAYNYLSGSIPTEWASTKLNFISVLVNRLSGEILKELGNITSLTYINLEGNRFSGIIPQELGKLKNLKTLILSSNQLEGELPISLSGLENLADFRISDNNLSGPIPDFIEKWKQLTKLELHATGLEGPIPSSISHLNMLTDLRISDIKGPMHEFPPIINMTGLEILVLRSCNLFGVIPGYIWKLKTIQTLDVSFNKLMGTIPDDISARSMLKFVFLSGNMLSGNIPAAILKNGINVDLSYNNFTWQSPEQPACRQNTNYYINLYKSSAAAGTLKNVLPCAEDVTCPRYGCSLHVNCGGNDVAIKENNRLIDYDGDAQVEGGSARNFRSDKYWGFSSTGDFMDDDNDQNTRFIETIPSTDLSELYSRARVSPLSLTYFRYCLENGSYNVSLHFAEIIFKDDGTYNSLGRRVFDIYVQEKLVRKDFNIEEEARGVQRPVIRYFNATVTDSVLEIRFYWAGKGTARIPLRGHYGSLISAISVDSTFKFCSNKGRKTGIIYVIVGALAACITFFVLSILWWKGCLCRKSKRRDLNGVELQMVCFTLKQIKAATKNFDASNKIGEGGFGPVYKGQLPDGTLVAVKQLSSQSKQGNREFLNEISTISCLQHPNLVKLHGCCIEADQLLLVYEYLDNNSLASILFENSQLRLDWPTRFRICLGIARGLAFLHEESSPKIVHRDIKATNVLLDGQLNPKISDFGLARLTEEEKTHISTRVAGTIGYMAPEYALWGYLTDKADVYSFGVVLLEIVSGKNNNNYMPSNNCICLLDWACHVQQSGSIEELIDQRLGSNINKQEVEKIVKVALLCTSATPSLRPIMSEVVAMLEGRITVPDEIPDASTYSNDLRFKAMKDFHQERQNQKLIESRSQNTMTIQTDMGSSSASTTNMFDSVHFQDQMGT